MFIMLLSSCKEVYYPDEIISNEKIPVILGSINEGKPPEAQLSWAADYEQNQLTSYIQDALVWITDDAGSYEMMEETARGKYAPVNENFVGIMGRTYTLHVETPEENLYESTPERISSTARLDSLFAVAVDRTRYIRTESGNLFPREEEGLDVMLSLNKESDSTCYFKFKTDVLTEIVYSIVIEDTLNPDSLMVDTLYEWTSSVLDDFYSVRFTHSGLSGQVIPEHNTGFLEFIYDPWLATAVKSAPLIYGWVVSAHVYTVSGNVYQYYNSVAEQLEASDRIFAPVPSQIKSNLYCVNNIDNKVMGVFEASSEIVFHKAFQWIESGIFISKDVDNFPENPGNGSVEGEPPDFWITF